MKIRKENVKIKRVHIDILVDDIDKASSMTNNGVIAAILEGLNDN